MDGYVVEDECDANTLVDEYDDLPLSVAWRNARVRQTGGENVTPVNVRHGSVIVDNHFVEISPRFNVQVGVFRVVPDEERVARAVGPLMADPMFGFQRVLFDLYDYMHNNFDPDDQVQVEILSRDLNGTVSSALVRVARADPVFLLNRLQHVIQSNQDLKVDSGGFSIQVTRVPALPGGGYESSRARILDTITTLTKDVLRKTRSLHDIPRELEPFCGVAALILGKELADSEGNLLTLEHQARWRRLCRPRLLRKRCRSVCNRACIRVGNDSISLPALEELAKSQFSEYEIVVYSTSSHMTPLAVMNRNGAAQGRIFLVLDNERHFALVTKLNAFLGKTGVYCPSCSKFFTGASRSHTCDTALCKQCKTANCGAERAGQGDWIRCNVCARGFHGRVCYDRHLVPAAFPLYRRGGKTVCASVMACTRCNRDLKAVNGVRTSRNAYNRSVAGREHVCFMNKCRGCREMVDFSTHQCFVTPLEVTAPHVRQNHLDKRGKNWFYDIETMKAYDPDRQMSVFVPNLVVLKSETGDRHVFRGRNCMARFCDFLFAADDSLANSAQHHRVFAHNGSRFDSIFILQGFSEVMSRDPSVVMEGLSPIVLRWCKCVILDTMKFFMCSLRAMGKMFDLPCEKKDFPHEFNTEDNQDYEGSIPAKGFFGVECMSNARRVEFEQEWERRNREIESGETGAWNLQNELLFYCERDVDVLMGSWLRFQKEMYEITGVFPGVENCSAASFTNMVWKSTIGRGEVGIVPVDNYVHNDKQSEVATEWLLWLNSTRFNGRIQFAGLSASGERRIRLPGVYYKVDGFNESTNTVFEFAGCFFSRL